MADRSINQLTAVTQVFDTDNFVLEQSGTAKRMTGQFLISWLATALAGHGGIKSISSPSSSGLVDTYTITFADDTTTTFRVTNGRSINSISAPSSSGLRDTYTISYNDGTTSTFVVTNGAKGDTGDNATIYIKYSTAQPTKNSDMHNTPDNWIGINSGSAATAPTSYREYDWFQIKGAKGDTGDDCTIVSTEVKYGEGYDTTTPPSTWYDNPPVIPQGNYLWSRTTVTYSTGNSTITYSASRIGRDGAGTVRSVNGVYADGDGNVDITGEFPSVSGTTLYLY